MLDFSVPRFCIYSDFFGDVRDVCKLIKGHFNCSEAIGAVLVVRYCVLGYTI